MSLITNDRYFYKNNEMIQIKTTGAINESGAKKTLSWIALLRSIKA
jgi:hypothetical protein